MNKNEMKKNVMEYSKEIKTITNFVEAVRRMPTRYIGHLGDEGYMNMFREVFQNAIDELVRVASPCDHIFVTFDERTHQVIVEDNGRGIPFDIIVDVFTKPNTSSNYEKKKGQYTSGRHGVGAKVTNALSSEFEVTSYNKYLKKTKHVKFIDGYWDKKDIETDNAENKQGTMISFKPSFEMMGDITIKTEDILNLIKSILHVTNIGSAVTFNAILLDNSAYHEEIVNNDGLLTFFIANEIKPLIKPIMCGLDNGEIKAEIIFTYDSNVTEDFTISYANYCPMKGGTHVDGFFDGVSRFFKKYMNKIYLAKTNSKRKKDNKLYLTSKDAKEGLCSVINACHIDPNFTGQAKEFLDNKDVKPFVENLVYSTLEEWSKSNPKDLQNVCGYLKQIIESRLNSEQNREKVSNNYKSSLNGLPKKFEAPKMLSGPGLEFIIVEGDSAGGHAKNKRNKSKQGVLPVKGKIPNAFVKSKKDIMNNDEVRDIINIATKGKIGKNIERHDVIWEKIILMPDADPDGDHIATLLLKLFLQYMIQVVQWGLLYKAVPPLYGIENHKDPNKDIYFTTRMDYIEYIENLFMQNNVIKDVNGNVIPRNDILSILYQNADYTYELSKIAKRYSIDPCLLEFVVNNRNNSIDKLRDIIRSKYRFTDIKDINGTKIIDTSYDSKIQTIFFNDRFMADISEIIKYIDRNVLQYYINDRPVTLYELMESFETIGATTHITRYKGLGEMDAAQLANSTLLPSSNRVLIQYTMENAIKEVERLKYLENNRFELVKDIVATRADLLG